MPNSPSDYGAFLPTTDVYDTEAIYSIDINSEEFKEFLVRLRQSTNNIALVVNIKDSGYYVLEEFVNGQLWFPNPTLTTPNVVMPIYRQVFRKTINFGALPNTATKTAAHGLSPTSDWTFTRVYGVASNTTGLAYLPIPYASPTLANNISLDVDATNVTITTGSNRTAYNQCYVVLEYIKQ